MIFKKQTYQPTRVFLLSAPVTLINVFYYLAELNDSTFFRLFYIEVIQKAKQNNIFKG